ncbi:MAG: aspartate kinase [Coprobacillus cateniformis]|uniref:Aspartokinase n=1 Tax=Longibaculum muris TaxID=1796628 RepID=A0A4R3YJV8_9FIRM|nr:aspartate kinase [Longibaculum muris]KXU42906.1 putative aspartate kinase II [Candidatus Stoquefichus sp. KLE1796]MBS5113407.1 aspartate kinase [Coprobacillus cateniformis]MBS5369366.1 aspartate kinase [Coprobacillus cateniformis]MCR1889130.1 aspartate kinase [Longibaculum muris]MED9810747.1 aspartate kinase [Longibaculum muris]
MKVIVQKFGGTSTRSVETREHMYKNIIRELEAGNKVVAVVSAMGRYDDPYATDTLLSIVNTDELTDEEIDRLTSIGETISTLVCKSELSKMGYNVETVTNVELGIQTDSHHMNATITTVEGHHIQEKLSRADIVICPGFQGYSQKGKVTTLGRGGSDLSAVAIGVAIDASEVEIYSDVNGIYTADPRIVPDAIKLDYISYAEMLELSKNGAKVLNHRCVQLAAKHDIVIHARSSFDASQGTYVLGDERIMKDHLNQLIISGITGSQNEARVTLVGVDAKVNGAGQLFEKIADANVNVNVFNQALVGGGKMDISLIINDKDVPAVVEVINDLKEILKPQKTIVRGNIGKVAVIGVGIKNNKGMFQKVYNTLMSNDINVEMTSCSEINISCYIDRDDVKKAQVLLHEAFLG